MQEFKCKHVEDGNREAFWHGYCERCHDVIFKPPVLRLEIPLTDDEYDGLLLLQGGRCALCGNYPKQERRLDTDHCHKTGRVRGLLCSQCNWMLIGRLECEKIPLSRVAKYLDLDRITPLNIFTEQLETV